MSKGQEEMTSGWGLSHERLNGSSVRGDTVCEGAGAECHRASSTSEDPGAGRSTEHLKTERGGFLCSWESQGESRSAEIRGMGKGRASQAPAGPTRN